MHEEINAASISLEKSTLSKEKLAQFCAYVGGISVADLEEEMTNFKDGNTVRQRILHFINQRTKLNETFPLNGQITSIGSSWDGTKVGHLDEVDTLYILNKDQLTILPGEHGEVDMENFRVKWKGGEYSASELAELFANALDEALRTDSPKGMEHNGYAAPRYSGIRASGPAVTVLFRTATNIGPMEMKRMVSLDITLALPYSYIQSDQQAVMDGIDAWSSKYITSTNDKPIDAVEPHVIPCRVRKGWKPTTAHVEANVLHELDRHCAMKKAHTLLKCLMKKVDTFNHTHRLFHVDVDESTPHLQLTKLIEQSVCLDDIDQVNRCMRYGYILLSPEERDKHNELKKKNISVNAAAAKQILFHNATEEDYKPGCADQSRALTLMKMVIADIAETHSLFVDNHIHHSFPPICKLSVQETLGGKFVELANAILGQYDTLGSSISMLVSIC